MYRPRLKFDLIMFDWFAYSLCIRSGRMLIRITEAMTEEEGRSEDDRYVPPYIL